MSRARVVIELLPKDPSGEKLVESLRRTFDIAHTGVNCFVEPKREFRIVKDFEFGAELIVRAATEQEEPWCVYLAPRRLDLIVNRADTFPMNAVIIAIARHKSPVALFLNTMTAQDIPPAISAALSAKVNSSLRKLIKGELPDSDEATVGRFQDAIAQAYAGAFAKSFLN